MTQTKRILLPALLCLIPVIAIGQPTAAGEPEVLISHNDYFFMNPQFSPDGSRIAFTTPQYQGLWVADADGRQASSLTDEEGAGFQFIWSPDSRHLVTGVSRLDGRIREFSLKLFDVENGAEQQLTPYARQAPPHPAFGNNGTDIIYHDGNGIQSVDSGIETAETGTIADVHTHAVPVINGILISDGSGDAGRVVRPVTGDDTDAVYLWPVVSHDGQKLAFRVYGEGLFISDLDGGNLIEIGSGEAPAWSPDSRYLSYMISEDDGHNITGSDIYIVDTATGAPAPVNVTAQSGLQAMYPTWAADGSRIAFSDVSSGTIYQVWLEY